MKKIVLTFALVTLTSTSLLANDDVLPEKLSMGYPYVRITQETDHKIKFEKCVYGYDSTPCTQLGRKNSYSLNELRSQRTVENFQIAGSLLADAGIVLGLFVGGFFAGPAISGTIGSASALTPAIVGATTGTVGSGITIASVDAVNPYEQTKQAQTLNDDVITDKQVLVNNIEDFIDRLDLVLSKI